MRRVRWAIPYDRGAVADKRQVESVAQVNFDGIGDPGSDAASEEIAILGPDGKIESERGGEDRPIIGIAMLNALACIALSACVVILLDEGDHRFDVIQEVESDLFGKAVFPADFGSPCACIQPANIRGQNIPSP